MRKRSLVNGFAIIGLLLALVFIAVLAYLARQHGHLNLGGGGSQSNQATLKLKLQLSSFKAEARIIGQTELIFNENSYDYCVSQTMAGLEGSNQTTDSPTRCQTFSYGEGISLRGCLRNAVASGDSIIIRKDGLFYRPMDLEPSQFQIILENQNKVGSELELYSSGTTRIIPQGSAGTITPVASASQQCSP